MPSWRLRANAALSNAANSPALDVLRVVAHVNELLCTDAVRQYIAAGTLRPPAYLRCAKRRRLKTTRHSVSGTASAAPDDQDAPRRRARTRCTDAGELSTTRKRGSDEVGASHRHWQQRANRPASTSSEVSRLSSRAEPSRVARKQEKKSKLKSKTTRIEFVRTRRRRASGVGRLARTRDCGAGGARHNCRRRLVKRRRSGFVNLSISLSLPLGTHWVLARWSPASSCAERGAPSTQRERRRARAAHRRAASAGSLNDDVDPLRNR